MITLTGIILPMLLAMIFGKHAGRITRSNYFLVAALALAQTCIVLIEMYTLKNPLD